MNGFPPRWPRTGRRQGASHNSTPLKALYVLRRMHTFSQRDGYILECRIRYIKSSCPKKLHSSGNIAPRFTRSTVRTQWGNPSPISAHPRPSTATSATPGRRA